MNSVAGFLIFLLGLLAMPLPAHPQAIEPGCGPFWSRSMPAPARPTDPDAVARFEAINRVVKSAAPGAIFFGDSLTEQWPADVWERQFTRFGALNAGIGSDRTENLLWRLEHGNLDGPEPKIAVLLIGVVDLAAGRPPELAAEGIRRNLAVLRARLPQSRVLLLGLLPWGERPTASTRLAVGLVNRRIASCSDGKRIFYADLGDTLLAGDGRLSDAVARRDRLHLTPPGYARLAERLGPLLERLLADRR